jgi:hypothetical protein
VHVSLLLLGFKNTVTVFCVLTSGAVRMPLAANIRSYKESDGVSMAMSMLITIVYHCLAQRRVWDLIDRNSVSFVQSIALSLLAALCLGFVKITGASIAAVLSMMLHLLIAACMGFAKITGAFISAVLSTALNLSITAVMAWLNVASWYIAYLQFTFRLTGIPESKTHHGGHFLGEYG